MTSQELAASINEIWAMFRETDRKFQETDRRFKETDRKFEEIARSIEENFQETARQFKESDRQFKETDRRLRELDGLFTGQWGKLIEALVRPGLLKLFQNWGIEELNESHQRIEVKRDGRQMEVDVLLKNGTVVIPVEVKTTLKVEDVREFLEKMQDFLFFFPEYTNYRVYGALAGVNIEEHADRYAYRQGLFVLTLGKQGLAEILNDARFVPRDLALPASDTIGE